jgi:hypothetical protein
MVMSGNFDVPAFAHCQTRKMPAFAPEHSYDRGGFLALNLAALGEMEADLHRFLSSPSTISGITHTAIQAQ